MYLLRFGEVAFYLGYNAMKNFFPMTQVPHFTAHTRFRSHLRFSAKSKPHLLQRLVRQTAGAVC
jgi:hypothetical protein